MFLKKKIKKLIPVKIIKLGKQILLCCYALGSRNRKSRVLKRNTSGRKISLIFLVYMPQEWNSLKSVYEKVRKHIDFVAYLIVIPYETHLSDGSIVNSVDYWQELYPEVICAWKENRWIDLKEYNPDIIFRQEPYEDTFPAFYSCKRLSSIARLCYISYGMTIDRRHLEKVYSDRFLCDVFAFFSDSKEVQSYLCEIKNKHPLIGSFRIFYYGFPRFELIDTSYRFSDRNRTFTWIPRWTVDAKTNDASSFFEYCKNLINFFKKNSDLCLIIRPHPMMFSNFLDKNLLSKEEIQSFFQCINELENVILDSEMDYLVTFKKTDVLIADFSSINMEFAISGKPIIYCGENIEGCLLGFSKYCICVKNWKELKVAIEELSDGCDRYRTERITYSKKYMKTIPTNISDNIINECIRLCRTSDKGIRGGEK